MCFISWEKIKWKNHVFLFLCNFLFGWKSGIWKGSYLSQSLQLAPRWPSTSVIAGHILIFGVSLRWSLKHFSWHRSRPGRVWPFLISHIHGYFKCLNILKVSPQRVFRAFYCIPIPVISCLRHLQVCSSPEALTQQYMMFSGAFSSYRLFSVWTVRWNRPVLQATSK